MTSDIKAIVFDYGGVLIGWDPRNLYRQYFPDRASMEQFLQEIDFMEWNARLDKGHPFAQGVAELARKFPHYAAPIHAYQRRWEESLTGEIPETVEILKRLKRKGYPLYGLSNWSAETFSLTRQKYPFFDLFDDMVVSGEVKLIKPDPGIFQILLSKINREPGECLFIDDAEKNVLAAHSLGFNAIQYESSSQLNKELRSLGILD